MKRQLKPLYTVEDLGVNHFTRNLVIPTTRLIIPNTYTQDENGNMINKTGDTEQTLFTKIFTTSDRRLVVNGLSPRAKELLLWIMFEISAGQDQLWLNKYRYMRENNISSLNTYKDAAKELVRYEFLRQTKVQDVFWINPDFFFKGSRITKYPKNLKRKDITGD